MIFIHFMGALGEGYVDTSRLAQAEVQNNR